MLPLLMHDEMRIDSGYLLSPPRHHALSQNKKGRARRKIVSFGGSAIFVWKTRSFPYLPRGKVWLFWIMRGIKLYLMYICNELTMQAK